MESKAASRFARPETTLPPGLHGPTKGEVLLLFRWTGATRNSLPGRVCQQTAQVLWWGERSPGATVQLAHNAERGLIYTVTCGPKAFARYLADMQQLQVTIVVEVGGVRHAAQSKVALSQLQASAQVTHRIPVKAADSCLLGTAALAVSLSHTPLTSSFEVNEHLASTDFSMPLYPATNRLVTPLRQLNIQHSSDLQQKLLAAKPAAYPTCVDSPAFKHPIASPTLSPAKQLSTCRPSLSDLLHELYR